MNSKLLVTPASTAGAIPRGLRVEEAAVYAGVTVWFIRTLIWRRAIPFILAGKRHIILREDIDRYMESQRVGMRP